MDLHHQFYIPAIQKIAFHLLHVFIIGTYPCFNTHGEAFKRCSYFQDLLCRLDYSESVLARFSHQIKSGYYGGNIMVSIEAIAL